MSDLIFIQVSFFDLKNLSEIFAKIFFRQSCFDENPQDLSLRVYRWSFGPNPPSKDIFLYLEPLSDLKQFSLDLCVYDDKKDDLNAAADHICKDAPYFRSTFQAIGSLQKLRDFEFLLPSSCNVISSEDLECLFPSVKQLDLLQTLSLTLNHGKDQGDFFNTLFQNITHLKLNCLSLTLEGTGWSSKVTFGGKEVVKFFFKPLILLSPQSRNISSFHFSTHELKNLSLALKKLDKLASLSLALPQINPTHKFQGFKNLLSALQEMPRLASLQLILKEKSCV